MTDEQRSEAKVKGGRIHVNDRIYKAIIGRPYTTVDELNRLQRAIDLYLIDAEEPFDLLLRAEFGNDICTLEEVDWGSYLISTPFSMIKMDFMQACMSIKDLYNSLSA